MTASIKTAPPNSFVLIADIVTEKGIPDFPTESRIASTTSCIAAGCETEGDGETRFTIGSEHHVNPIGRPVFDGVVKTPNKKITVWTVELDKLLEVPVSGTRTRVRIWGNRPKFPDDVVIGLSEPD